MRVAVEKTNNHGTREGEAPAEPKKSTREGEAPAEPKKHPGGRSSC